MNKIVLIIKREYLTRVRKRSFLVMTFLGPVLMAAMIILPIYFTHLSEKTEQKVLVLDETGWFFQKFKDQDNMHFTYTEEALNEAKEQALKNKELLLYIPLTHLNIPVNAELYSSEQSSMTVRAYIKMVMKQVVEEKKLMAQGINPEDIKSARVEINIETIKVGENGSEEKVNTDFEVLLAVFSGIMIYFFIFMFGSQVLRGVMEEKSNRIVEVIISSVKPFQLMMGKIVGIALVGLTQFLLWILFTFLLVGIFQGVFGGSMSDMQQGLVSGNAAVQNLESSLSGQGHVAALQVSDILSQIDIGVMIGSFLFYFLFGYLMYASMFAGVGGAIDHDADVQQFMLPISAPLIFSVALTGVIANQPGSPLAFWLSMFPLTSPVIMMIRIPFGVPYWQVGLSALLLVASFLVSTFVAGKIYRIGILVYGKKITYRQLWKWLRY
ncbi:MAG: ABC transporter permease [Bacteroidales bacterium]|nr:ABC transporter permease [Bacteroidales bacterium]